MRLQNSFGRSILRASAGLNSLAKPEAQVSLRIAMVRDRAWSLRHGVPTKGSILFAPELDPRKAVAVLRESQIRFVRR